MSINESAITIWVDESTDILINGEEYNLVGYLITDSDKNEFLFLNQLKQVRKSIPQCWTTMHGCEIREGDSREIDLIDRWFKCFEDNDNVYFHAFLYKKNSSFIPKGKTYENYFAKQSVFAIAYKMKKSGYPINTMFKDVSTLTVLFDRRRSHSADIIDKGGKKKISRLNDLENIYKKEIINQIEKVSGKNSKTTELTIRFSFLSSECFDGMQFSDCFLYVLRKKIEQEVGNQKENKFTKLFDKYFLDSLPANVRILSFRNIYKYEKKLNFFELN